jgi:hypothetical protein
MAERQVSIRHRVQAIDQLEGTAAFLNTMASWLAERGLENEADAIDVAAKNCLSACWWLSRPLRPQLPPTRWHDGGMGRDVPYQQAADQQRPA